MNIVNVRDTSEICQYSYGILSVYLCRTFGARGLHYRCQGAALLLALLFESLYSGFSVGRRTSFLHSIILNRRSRQFFIGFTFGRRTLFLHSSFFILIAAWRSVSLRLQSLNQKTLTDYHWFITESLHGSVFWFFLFDLNFDFRLIWIVPWQDKGI